MKCLVIGNCQARPLTIIIKNIKRDWDVLEPVIVHLAKLEDSAHVENLCKQADLIICQLVADAYHIPFVRTSYLKTQYSGKCVVWPNIYWRGLTPEIIYIRTHAGQTISGPLGEYHNQIIFQSWFDGVAVDVCVDYMQNECFNFERYAKIPEKSLAELREREKLVDVCISYFLEEQYSERTFWVMNHPTNRVMEELAQLVLRYIDSSIPSQNNLPGATEFLGAFRPAVNPIRRIKTEPVRIHIGRQVVFEEASVNINQKQVVQYSDRELAECFYKLYDGFGQEYPFRLPLG